MIQEVNFVMDEIDHMQVEWRPVSIQSNQSKEKTFGSEGNS